MPNILQQVQTYQKSGLALMLNSYAFINTANKKFKDFEKLTANLGDTVTFDLPSRFTTTNSLVATFQDVEQRVESLTVDNAANTSFAFTAQQFIFNVKDYMKTFGNDAIAEIGSQVEANVAEQCVKAPYRFYGDGVAQITTFNQLAGALALYRNFGAAKTETKGFISDIAVPQIVNSGLNQFATNRNNEMAMSWQLGDFSRCEWYQSNLLPVHIAGSEGQAAVTLTVVSVTKNADDAVTSITFSGTSAASDPDSVKIYDKFQFRDGVAGQPNMRFLTFIGHKQSSCPVQFRATANAASTGGSQVTVNIYPPLKASAGRNQNINNEIAAGMQVNVLPSHRAGVIHAGNPFYLAMPQLPEETPFPTANSTDPASGATIRMYHGSLFGQNQRGTIYDVIWGSRLVPDYGMSVIFPLSQ